MQHVATYCVLNLHTMKHAGHALPDYKQPEKQLGFVSIIALMFYDKRCIHSSILQSRQQQFKGLLLSHGLHAHRITTFV